MVNIFVGGFGSVGRGIVSQLENFIQHTGLSVETVTAIDSSGFIKITPDRQTIEHILQMKNDGLDVSGMLESFGPVSDDVSELSPLINQGDIVFNAISTNFNTPQEEWPIACCSEGYLDFLTENGYHALAFDIAALENGANVFSAHKENAVFPQAARYTLSRVGAWGLPENSYDPTGSVMGPTRVYNMMNKLLEHGVKVKGVEGIVNGTCNFMLTQLEEGINEKEALKVAQERGYAETDPSADVRGYDAMSKIAMVPFIFSSDASFTKNVYGMQEAVRRFRKGNGSNIYKLSPEQFDGNLGIEGITQEITKALSLKDHTIRLVGSYKNGIAEVGPRIISLDHPFASVKGTNNCLILETEGDYDLGIFEDVFGGKLSDHSPNRATISIPYTTKEGLKARYTILLEKTEDRLIVKGPGAGGQETAKGMLDSAAYMLRQENRTYSHR